MNGRQLGWKALGVAVVLGGAVGLLIALRPLVWGRRSRVVSGEMTAPACLRTCSGAQNMYRRTDYDGDGVFEYAFPYTLLSTQLDENGERISFIDDSFAGASRDNPPGGKAAPRSGYFFVDITADAGGEAYDDGEGNFVNGYGLCGYPADYGRTGRYTFIVDIYGTVYRKDTGGKPVTVFPDVEKEGWETVGPSSRR